MFTLMVLFWPTIALTEADTSSSQPPLTVSVVSGPTTNIPVLISHGVYSSTH
jgi:hypothetical protein